MGWSVTEKFQYIHATVLVAENWKFGEWVWFALFMQGAATTLNLFLTLFSSICASNSQLFLDHVWLLSVSFCRSLFCSPFSCSGRRKSVCIFLNEVHKHALWNYLQSLVTPHLWRRGRKFRPGQQRGNFYASSVFWSSHTPKANSPKNKAKRSLRQEQNTPT